MSMPGVGSLAGARTVPWTEEPGLSATPGTCVSPTPLVQGVVSLLHPLLPSPPPPSCILPPAHTVLRSKPCALQAAWPSLPVLPPPGPARAGGSGRRPWSPHSLVAEGHQPTQARLIAGPSVPTEDTSAHGLLFWSHDTNSDLSLVMCSQWQKTKRLYFLVNFKGRSNF